MTLNASMWAVDPDLPEPAPRRPAAPPAARLAVPVTAAALTPRNAVPSTPRAAALAPQPRDTTNVTPRTGSPALSAASGPKLFNPNSEALKEAASFRGEITRGGGAKKGGRGSPSYLESQPVARSSAISPARYGVTSPLPRITACPTNAPRSSTTEPSVTTQLTTRGQQTQDPSAEPIIAWSRFSGVQSEHQKQVSEPRLEVPSTSALHINNVGGTTAPPTQIERPRSASNLLSPQSVQRTDTAEVQLAREEENRVYLEGLSAGKSVKEATKESLAPSAPVPSSLPPHLRGQTVAVAAPASPDATPKPLVSRAASVVGWEKSELGKRAQMVAKANAAPIAAKGAQAAHLPNAQPIAAIYQTAQATISATISPLDFENAEHKAAAVKTEQILRKHIERSGRVEQQADEVKVKTEPGLSADEGVLGSNTKGVQFGHFHVHEKVIAQQEWSQKTEVQKEAAADDHSRNGNEVWSSGTLSTTKIPHARAAQATEPSKQNLTDQLKKLFRERKALVAEREQLTASLNEVTASHAEIEKHIGLLIENLEEG